MLRPRPPPAVPASVTPSAQNRPARGPRRPARIAGSLRHPAIFLTARDPHWLYAHWDMTREQLKKYNALSVDGHLVLRIHRDHLGGGPLSQIHVHPESRNWFAPCRMPPQNIWPTWATTTPAQMGRAARSGATLTPPDSFSEETRSVSPPFRLMFPLRNCWRWSKAPCASMCRWSRPLQQMRAQGFKDLPRPQQIREEWTPAQEKALAEIVSMDQVRRIWIGSLEITELVRRQLQQQVSSVGAAQFSLPSSAMGVPSSVSSPFGGPAPPARLLVQRQRGIDYLRRDRTGRHRHHRRADNQTAARRHLQFPLRAAGRRIFACRRRRIRPTARRRAGRISSSAGAPAYQGDVGAHPQDKRLATAAGQRRGLSVVVAGSGPAFFFSHEPLRQSCPCGLAFAGLGSAC